MNFVKNIGLNVRILKIKVLVCFFLFLVPLFSIYIVGCSDEVILPSTDQLIEFENAGPPPPRIDLEKLVKAKVSGIPYQVKPGEVLELTMPAVLQVVTTDESVNQDADDVYICRVSERGTIALPVVGQINVAGKTLSQIESDVIDAYYPEYSLTLPSVFARVLEYKTAKVTISGAVAKPGIYSLRSDQMSLVALIMTAEGIIEEGAALVRIIHAEEEPANERESIPKIKQVSRAINTKPLQFSLPYTQSDYVKVRMNFAQISDRGTIGIMTIIYDQKVLLTDQIDIASEIERLALLKQLSWKKPQISSSDIGQKLRALAELLKPGSGNSEIEKSIANENMIMLTDVNNGHKKSWTVHEKITAQEPKNFTAESWLQPEMRPLLLKSDYNITGGITNRRSMYSNAAFRTSYSTQDHDTYISISEELLPNPNMGTNQKTVEEVVSKDIQESESIVLPVKGYNIPFTDIVLQDGDTVIVERLGQPLFSVVGLVNNPGNFSYPLNVRYNLIQALSFAGGLNPSAEPRYATIYRLKSDGTVVHATFEIVSIKNSSQLTDALNVQIKPGDIVSVEHTPRTRTKMFLDRVFRLNIGTYFNLNDAWND